MSESSARPGLVTRVARAWRRHPVLGTLFPAALALTLFFAAEAVLRAAYWADPAHRDQTVAGWMTPRYVAKSWDVPPELMATALGQKPDRTDGPPTLNWIARERGVDPATLIAQIEAAIAAHRIGQTPPPTAENRE